MKVWRGRGRELVLNEGLLFAKLAQALPGGRWFPHFTDEETDTEKLSNWPKVTQPVYQWPSQDSKDCAYIPFRAEIGSSEGCGIERSFHLKGTYSCSSSDSGW